MAKGADSAFTRWSGKVTTRLGAEKTPITAFEGTWTKLRGTGRYTGIKGTGQYQGHMTSPTEYLIQWSGEIEGGKMAAK